MILFSTMRVELSFVNLESLFISYPIENWTAILITVEIVCYCYIRDCDLPNAGSYWLVSAYLRAHCIIVIVELDCRLGIGN